MRNRAHPCWDLREEVAKIHCPAQVDETEGTGCKLLAALSVGEWRGALLEVALREEKGLVAFDAELRARPAAERLAEGGLVGGSCGDRSLSSQLRELGCGHGTDGCEGGVGKDEVRVGCDRRDGELVEDVHDRAVVTHFGPASKLRDRGKDPALIHERRVGGEGCGCIWRVEKWRERLTNDRATVGADHLRERANARGTERGIGVAIAKDEGEDGLR